MPLNLRSLILVLIALAGFAGGLLFIRPSTGGKRSVVVYTSVDAEFALPFFKKFTEDTGIEVVPRTDSESNKTTSMAERLIQMKDAPDGDVFWNSELSFTQVLAGKGALQAYASPQAQNIPANFKDTKGLWTGFGCRARVIIYNTQRVKREELPKTLEDFADPKWKGRFTVAKPLFGTTRSHLVSLVIEEGEEKAFKLFRAWRENGVVIAASNGDVRDRVAGGLSDIGLTDTDDAFSAMERNKPVDFTVPDQTSVWRGAYLIPNTVSMLNNCQHPDEAKVFIDYLLRPDSEKWLAENGAKQIPVRDVGANLAASLKNLTAAKVNVERLAAEVLPLGERIYRVLTGEEK